MTTHEGLRARASRTRSVNSLLALCKGKRFIRLLTIRAELKAKV